jgi:hypothetical protein
VVVVQGGPNGSLGSQVVVQDGSLGSQVVVGNMVVVGAGVVHSGGAWSNVRHAGLPLHELSYP